jgi:hypothetical protein
MGLQLKSGQSDCFLRLGEMSCEVLGLFCFHFVPFFSQIIFSLKIGTECWLSFYGQALTLGTVLIRERARVHQWACLWDSCGGAEFQFNIC